jgi:hypothetical protein
MTLKANEVKSQGGSNRVEQPSLPAGGYPARVVQIYDLGVQARKPYMGEEKPPINMILPVYELADEFMIDEDGNEVLDKPRWIFDRPFALFPLSADRAISTQRYEAIDPDNKYNGDWGQVVGSPVTVNIVNNKAADGRVFDNVGSLSAMRQKEADKLPELINDPFVLSLDSDDVEAFNKTPQWLQDKIKTGVEWESTKMYAALNGEALEPKETPPNDVPEQNDDEDDGAW